MITSFLVYQLKNANINLEGVWGGGGGERGKLSDFLALTI